MSMFTDFILFLPVRLPLRKWCGGLSLRPLALLSIALAGLMLCARQGSAESWQNAVSTRVATEYDSNPAMNPAYQGGVWRVLVEPGYTLTRASDADELKAGLGLIVARSSDKTVSQDREDPSVFLNLRHQVQSGVLSLSARYDEESTRVAEYNPAVLIFVDGTRASRTLSGSWSQALGERNTLVADGEYSNIRYTESPYADYLTRSGSIMLKHAWSERSEPFVRFLYVDYVPADNLPVDRRYTSLLGLNLKITDQLEGNIQAGQTRGVSAGSDSLQGGVGLRYTGQQSRFTLNAERQDVTPTGLGGFVTSDQVNGGWSYDFSERSRTGIDLLWRRSHFITDSLYRTAGAWNERELSSFWRMRAYYLRRVSGGDEINSAASNMMGLSFTYTDPNL